MGLMSMSTLSRRTFSVKTDFRVDHLVIGGGVVGLAIASALSSLGSTLVVERNAKTGQETSSRNSQVIHSGIYYPPRSLKTRLCIRGKDLIYTESEKYGISHKRLGKLIVGQSSKQHEYLRTLHEKAESLGIETSLLSEEQVREMEPAVRAKYGALFSPSSGIIDVHEFMLHLEGRISSKGGMVVTHTEVIDAIYLPMWNEYAIKTSSRSASDSTLSDSNTWIAAKTVVNAAGLHSASVFNLLEKKSIPKYKMYYCKGNYWTHSPSLNNQVSRLIYPCPEENLMGLGIHLTLDLDGMIRFGPDVEYVHDLNYNIPSENKDKLNTIAKAIQNYLPIVSRKGLIPDYAGIRPKLSGPGEPMKDFVIEEEEEHRRWINCIGIESPGLTSSLAIGEYVRDMIRAI